MFKKDLEWKTPFDAEIICIRHMGPFGMQVFEISKFILDLKKKSRPPPPEKVVLEALPVALFFKVDHPMRNEKLGQATDFGDPSLNME